MMVKQDTTPDAPAHTKGTSRGEQKAKEEGQEPGHQDTGTDSAGRPTATSTARKSTSINAENEEPIDTAMPNMPPA